MDKIDREIISILRGEARISYKELSERVFLSANAVTERMRRLEQLGIIQGYEAVIDMRAMELPLSAIIEIKLAAQVTALDFEKKLGQISGILGADLVTGAFDYLLRVACRDQEDLVRITETLRAKCGVQESNTKLILKAVRLKL